MRDAVANRETALAELDSMKRFVTNITTVKFLDLLMLEKLTTFLRESGLLTHFGNHGRMPSTRA